MSETHTTSHNSTRRRGAHQEHDATTTPNGADTTTTTHTAPHAPAALGFATLPPVTFELKFDGETKVPVTVARRRGKGYILANDSEALTLDMAEIRQFTNNINANALARAKRLAAAKTEAEVAANQPYTAAEVLALWENYRPNVGGAPRQNAVEKFNLDAAWRAWVKRVTDHLSGVDPNPEWQGKAVSVMQPPVRAKGVDEAVHKAALEQFQEVKTAFLRQMLAMPKYAGIIEAAKAAILAERGAEKKKEVRTVDADAMMSLL